VIFVIPADPARQVCGQRATAECIVRARHFLGLDQPMIVQYGRILDRLVVHQSLGRSFTNRQDVTRQVLNAAPVTASLVFGGAAIWLLVAIPVGILSALRPRSLIDRVTMVSVLVGISAHPVWICLLGVYFLGLRLQLVPITGYCDFFAPTGDCGGPTQWAYHLLCPSAASPCSTRPRTCA
jgi:peptide/nickel transport system permease protein